LILKFACPLNLDELNFPKKRVAQVSASKGNSIFIARRFPLEHAPVMLLVTLI
jgi:hypothetical protein